MDIKRCFEILEIDPGASPEEVKQAYRDLVYFWHPDRVGDDPRRKRKAEEKLKKINEAYDILSSRAALQQSGTASDEVARERQNDRSRKAQNKPFSNDIKKTIIISSIKCEMVYIYPGTFMMGNPPSEPDYDEEDALSVGMYESALEREKQYPVTITKGFYMQTTVVTQGQWYALMGTRPWSGQEEVCESDDYPAIYLSWHDCSEFVTRLNEQEGGSKFRLPTEAEWEYACRANSPTRFCFGDSEYLLEEYAWYRKNAYDVGEFYAHKVRTRKANVWGLYDMHGHVSEGCQDWYKFYPDSFATDPSGPSFGQYRINRGGSWYWSGDECRSANRSFITPDYKGSIVGFRLLREI